MTEEGISGSLSAEEKSYFDTRGGSEPPVIEADEPATEPVVGSDPDLGPADTDTNDHADDTEGGQRRPVNVPLAALKEERLANKELRDKIANVERQNAVWEERWNLVLKPPEQQEKNPADDLPDENDPVGGINWLLSQEKARREQTAKEANERQQSDEQTQRAQAARDVAREHLATAYKEDTTLPQVFDAFKANFIQEMRAIGATDEQIVASYPAYEDQQIAHALTHKVNFATYLRNVATARGFRPQPVEQNEPADPVAEIESLDERIEGAASLSSAGGGRVPVTDARAVADMSPAEFEAWYAKPGNQQKFKRLAGGR